RRGGAGARGGGDRRQPVDRRVAGGAGRRRPRQRDVDGVRAGRRAAAARAALAAAGALRRAPGLGVRALGRRGAHAARRRRRQPDGAAVSWEELVATALIGTERRPVHTTV